MRHVRFVGIALVSASPLLFATPSASANGYAPAGSTGTAPYALDLSDMDCQDIPQSLSIVPGAGGGSDLLLVTCTDGVALIALTGPGTAEYRVHFKRTTPNGLVIFTPTLVADVTGDGRTTLGVCLYTYDNGGNTTGGGSFLTTMAADGSVPPPKPLRRGGCSALAWGDIDADGRNEIIEGLSLNPHTAGQIAWFDRTGTRWRQVGHLAAHDPVGDIWFADTDNDQHPDTNLWLDWDPGSHAVVIPAKSHPAIDLHGTPAPRPDHLTISGHFTDGRTVETAYVTDDAQDLLQLRGIPGASGTGNVTRSASFVEYEVK
jgi:hypothetical protein